jgi:hypothetical protein
MDTTLVTVTVLSMGMAAALSVIVWWLLREERRRSEARIAALQAAARAPILATPPSAAVAAPASTAAPDARGLAADAPPKAKPAPVIAVFKRQPWVSDAAADLPLRSEQAPAAPRPIADGPMFVEPVRTPAWSNRLGIMAAIVLVGASALLFAMTASKARATAAAGTALAQSPTEAGLELISLHDAHANGTLTITGMVRNPHSASLLTRVTVTAYTFDDKGAFLASGRALLDVTSLAPGDDSPFVVTVPVTDAVARYRIGFRGEDGRVIGHVDHRQQGPMAALRLNPDTMQ